MISRMPHFYRDPFGLPLRWQDEQSGKLPEAVNAFWHQQATEAQLALVSAYLRYYINAPCWDMGTAGYEDGQHKLAKAREKAASLQSAEDMNEFLSMCLEMGIDPL